MKITDDISAIEQTLKGNRNAYGYLVDNYKHMAYTLAYRMLGNHEEAEEAAQDSFIKAYKSLATFRKNSKFSTWLYTIVYNTSISRIRKKKTSPEKAEYIDEVKYQDSYGGIDKLHAEEQKIIIEHALEKLSSVEAAIISMFYLDDMTIEEIAKVTGLKRSNVKVKLHRSRNKLYSIIKSLLKNEINAIL